MRVALTTSSQGTAMPEQTSFVFKRLRDIMEADLPTTKQTKTQNTFVQIIFA
jgi:hypothetical protein